MEGKNIMDDMNDQEKFQHDDIDSLYLETTKIKNTKKKAKKMNTIKKSIPIEIVEAVEDFKKAKAEHRAEIATLRRYIRSHRLMIKQARTQYKIVKLQEK